MKDIPIIFSTPMVPPIMDGSKTNTRRIMKPQPTDGPEGWLWFCPRQRRISGSAFCREYEAPNHCPYGQPGDRLWVREAWGIFDSYRLSMRTKLIRNKLLFKADMISGTKQSPPGYGILYPLRGWKPSIHMRKEHARLWLTRKSPARIERVQDITEAGALAEGFKNRDEFLAYWDKLHKKPGHRVADNPWVWVPDWHPWKGAE